MSRSTDPLDDGLIVLILVLVVVALFGYAPAALIGIVEMETAPMIVSIWAWLIVFALPFLNKKEN